MAAAAPRPRDAATLVLFRRRRGATEILMGRRRQRAAFMPGFYVFPGGRLDPADARARAASELREDVMAQLLPFASRRRSRALAMAAVRETFEETGLVLGRPGIRQGVDAPPAWQAFDRTGLAPALDVLDYVGRAITPPGQPRRFHARFFIADSTHLRGTLTHGGELLDLGFIAAEVARELPTASITRFVLAGIEGLLAATGDPGARPPPFAFVNRRPRLTPV